VEQGEPLLRKGFEFRRMTLRGPGCGLTMGAFTIVGFGLRPISQRKPSDPERSFPARWSGRPSLGCVWVCVLIAVTLAAVPVRLAPQENTDRHHQTHLGSVMSKRFS